MENNGLRKQDYDTLRDEKLESLSDDLQNSIATIERVVKQHGELVEVLEEANKEDLKELLEESKKQIANLEEQADELRKRLLCLNEVRTYLCADVDAFTPKDCCKALGNYLGDSKSVITKLLIVFGLIGK